jgi:hypothetical protein
VNWIILASAGIIQIVARMIEAPAHFIQIIAVPVDIIQVVAGLAHIIQTIAVPPQTI